MKWALLGLFLCAGIVGTVLCFQHWPEVRFRASLARLSVSSDGAPEYAGERSDSFSLNMDSDEVSSMMIGDMYDAACRRLDRLRGSHPRRTYHWYDGMGWDHVTSVVEFPAGHMTVTAANYNENDSVDVAVIPGKFPPAGHSRFQYRELKELPNDRLPAKTLGFQRDLE